MKLNKPKNMAASVHQRLIKLSKKRGDDPNMILIHYAVERFLYRLSLTREADQYILKGAMLFAVWTDKPYRSTRDLDLLAQGSSSLERIKLFVNMLCKMQVEDDGLLFDASSLQIEEIKPEDEYDGFRVHLNAYLGYARIRIQVDIAFGDIVTPEIQTIEYPVLLNFPKPKLLAYPPESVVAEKLQAIVKLGMANSRMKDYYDLFILVQQFSFKLPTLKKAIQATFKRRRTDIPNTIPIGLSELFAIHEHKQKQWAGFIKRYQIRDVPERFEIVVSNIRSFFTPEYFRS